MLKAVRARDADKLGALVAPGVRWQVGHWEQGALVIRDDEDDRLYHCNIERGSSARRVAYSELGSSDHDHCELCWAKFMTDAWPGVRVEGHAVDAGRSWLCPDCYDEVKAHLALTETP